MKEQREESFVNPASIWKQEKIREKSVKDIEKDFLEKLGKRFTSAITIVALATTINLNCTNKKKAQEKKEKEKIQLRALVAASEYLKKINIPTAVGLTISGKNQFKIGEDGKVCYTATAQLNNGAKIAVTDSTWSLTEKSDGLILTQDGCLEIKQPINTATLHIQATRNNLTANKNVSVTEGLSSIRGSIAGNTEFNELDASNQCYSFELESGENTQQVTWSLQNTVEGKIILTPSGNTACISLNGLANNREVVLKVSANTFTTEKKITIIPLEIPYFYILLMNPGLLTGGNEMVPGAIDNLWGKCFIEQRRAFGFGIDPYTCKDQISGAQWLLFKLFTHAHAADISIDLSGFLGDVANLFYDKHIRPSIDRSVNSIVKEGEAFVKRILFSPEVQRAGTDALVSVMNLITGGAANPVVAILTGGTGPLLMSLLLGGQGGDPRMGEVLQKMDVMDKKLDKVIEDLARMQNYLYTMQDANYNAGLVEQYARIYSRKQMILDLMKAGNMTEAKKVSKELAVDFTWDEVLTILYTNGGAKMRHAQDTNLLGYETITSFYQGNWQKVSSRQCYFWPVSWECDIVYGYVPVFYFTLPSRKAIGSLSISDTQKLMATIKTRFDINELAYANDRAYKRALNKVLAERYKTVLISLRNGLNNSFQRVLDQRDTYASRSYVEYQYNNGGGRSEQKKLIGTTPETLSADMDKFIKSNYDNLTFHLAEIDMMILYLNYHIYLGGLQ